MQDNRARFFFENKEAPAGLFRAQRFSGPRPVPDGVRNRKGAHPAVSHKIFAATGGYKMNANEKIALLERRLRSLLTNDRDNHGIQQKIRRQIRNLKKIADQEGG